MASQFFGKNTLIHYNMARGSCNWEGNIQDEKLFLIVISSQLAVKEVRIKLNWIAGFFMYGFH